MTLEDESSPTGKALAPLPIPLLPPRPDGGTTFCCKVDVKRWAIRPEHVKNGCFAMWLRLMPELRRELTEVEEKQHRDQKGRIVELAIGSELEIATVVVTGMRRQRFTFTVEDQAHISVNIESGQIRCELKAKALWVADWPGAISRWLEGLAMFFSGDVVTLDISRAWGWECTRLELCCDFINFELAANDRNRFCTRSKCMIMDKAKLVEGKDAADGMPVTDGSALIETIQVGTRGNNFSMSTYDKTNQVNVHRRGSNSCNYVAAWLFGGRWRGGTTQDGRLWGPNVRRVEIRLKDRGLELIERDEDTGNSATDYNLRDPAKVCDPKALGTAWLWGTTRCARLINLKCEKTGDAYTRKSRASTDRAWVEVQNAGRLLWKNDDARDLKQSRRMAEDVHEERKRRSSRKTAMSVEEFGAQHGVKATTTSGRALLLEFARRFVKKDALDPEPYRQVYQHRFASAFCREVDISRGELVEYLQGDGAHLYNRLQPGELVAVVPYVKERDKATGEYTGWHPGEWEEGPPGREKFGELVFSIEESQRLYPPPEREEREPHEQEQREWDFEDE